VGKLQKVPFDQIGQHLDQTLVTLDSTLKQVNGKVLPELKGTLEGARRTLGSADSALSSDSPLQQELAGTLAELQRMARSLRVLTDYLGVHPEALIRGRRDAPVPAPRTPQKPPTQQGSTP
jgi:paraquat-inducible protein B